MFILETGLPGLVKTRLALDGVSVKWGKMFHMKALSHPSGMDVFADFDLQYSLVLNGKVGK